MYHLVRKVYYDSLDPNLDYVREAFGRDRFIHCTNNREEMGRVANLFYTEEPTPHIYLRIDKANVRAPVRYEDADPERKFPHIYGPLNRDAIVAVRVARRDSAGIFLAPDEEPSGSEI